MPGVNDYPLMSGLTGTEKVLGSQGDATKTVTVQSIADFAATQAVAGVSSVNGQTGALTLNAASVGADPAGAAATAESNATAAARDALDAHRLSDTAHTKAQVGLGNVDNTADLDKPISTATQSALDTLTTSVNGKVGKGPNDGVMRVIQNGELVDAPTITGDTTQHVAESRYAGLTKDPKVGYWVLPNPNLVSTDFGVGWTPNAGYAVSGGNAVLQGSTGFDLTYPLSSLPHPLKALEAGRTYEVTFTVIDHIKANLTPGFVTDGTVKLHTTTRQGTASPGTDATYTVQFAPTGAAPTAFLIRCNPQDAAALQCTISAPSVKEVT